MTKETKSKITDISVYLSGIASFVFLADWVWGIVMVLDKGLLLGLGLLSMLVFVFSTYISMRMRYSELLEFKQRILPSNQANKNLDELIDEKLSEIKKEPQRRAESIQSLTNLIDEQVRKSMHDHLEKDHPCS